VVEIVANSNGEIAEHVSQFLARCTAGNRARRLGIDQPTAVSSQLTTSASNLMAHELARPPAGDVAPSATVTNHREPSILPHATGTAAGSTGDSIPVWFTAGSDERSELLTAATRADRRR
jgi:hypothetical protein